MRKKPVNMDARPSETGSRKHEWDERVSITKALLSIACVIFATVFMALKSPVIAVDRRHQSFLNATNAISCLSHHEISLNGHSDVFGWQKSRLNCLGNLVARCVRFWASIKINRTSIIAVNCDGLLKFGGLCKQCGAMFICSVHLIYLNWFAMWHVNHFIKEEKSITAKYQAFANTLAMISSKIRNCLSCLAIKTESENDAERVQNRNKFNECWDLLKKQNDGIV